MLLIPVKNQYAIRNLPVIAWNFMFIFTFIFCDNLAISTCRNIIQPVRQIVGQRSIIIELQSAVPINLGEIQFKCIW